MTRNINIKSNREIAATLRHPAELVAHGLVPAAALPDLEQVAARYAVAVTPEVAALIDAGDPVIRSRDGICRTSTNWCRARRKRRSDWRPCPLPVAGIVHRYPTACCSLVHVCAVYCRFCYRREMVGPGKETALSQRALPMR